MDSFMGLLQIHAYFMAKKPSSARQSTSIVKSGCAVCIVKLIKEDWPIVLQ